MPYDDPEKQRENVKIAVRRHREKKKQAKYCTNGELDTRKFLNANKGKLLNAIIDGLDGKRTNSQLLRLVAQLTGDLVEKTEDTVKVEFTIADRQQAAADLIEGLRRETETTGICVVCGQRKALRLESCSNPEPEHTKDSEVATVAVST